MATLYKKPNSPNWFAQFFDANGKRISRSTGTSKKREAEKIAGGLEAKERERKKGDAHLPKKFAAIVETAAREAEARELTLARADDLVRRLHQLANPSFRLVTVKDHLANWVLSQTDHVASSSLDTYRDMERRIIAALGPKISSKAIGDLTKDEVEKALSKIAKTKVKGTERHIKASTINMDLRALRRALREAVNSGLAKSNVAEDIRPRPESDSVERGPFTTEEVRLLIDHPGTSDQWRGTIIIAAHTGLRLGDVIKLNRDHLDGSRLVIRPQKTKKKKEEITVPLTPPCLKWIGERQGNFFPDLKGTKTGTLSTQFVRIMERAGVPRDVTKNDVTKRRSFHSLRHTFASWLAEADVHADVRQKLTGHKSAGVHGRYTHHDEALNRAVETLPTL